jgi:hypothetical protein
LDAIPAAFQAALADRDTADIRLQELVSGQEVLAGPAVSCPPGDLGMVALDREVSHQDQEAGLGASQALVVQVLTQEAAALAV